MKYSAIFNERIGCKSSADVFNYLMSTLMEKGITGWDYFVNWSRVFGNLDAIEIDLNTMNYLIGKENIEAAFDELLSREPKIARLVPILVACRDMNPDILIESTEGKVAYKHYSFSDDGPQTPSERKDVIEFARESGFLPLMKSKRIKSVVDYVIGVEVGLDSNGRKNRSGTTMEKIVESYVAACCRKHSFRYVPQATAAKMKSELGCETKAAFKRTVDFAIHNGKRLYIVEANFYGGGGSKLKATAGEYRTMSGQWAANDCGYIWITDGIGWRSTRKPLEEAFSSIDYILNLDMVGHGLLEDILLKNL